MANTQTKLTAEKRADLKTLRSNPYYKNAVIFQDTKDSNATVMLLPARAGDTLERAKFVYVSVAYASQTENKVRAKVGQFLVAIRMDQGHSIVLTKGCAYALLRSLGLYCEPIPFAK